MWKIIEGFDDLYSISDLGEVRNNNRNKLLTLGYNKDYKNKKGYRVVKLLIPYDKDIGEIKSYKTLYIHRLVAQYFIDNPDGKPCINHKDGNKNNNIVDNLEWVTHKENMQHSMCTGLHDSIKKTKLSTEELDKAIELVLNNNYTTKDLMKHFSVCCNIGNWINTRAKETGLYNILRQKKLLQKQFATSNENKRKYIRYYGIDSEGNSTKEYTTLTEASKDLGIGQGNISNSIRKSVRAGGYKWKIKNLLEKNF